MVADAAVQRVAVLVAPKGRGWEADAESRGTEEEVEEEAAEEDIDGAAPMVWS